MCVCARAVLSPIVRSLLIIVYIFIITLYDTLKTIQFPFFFVSSFVGRASVCKRSWRDTRHNSVTQWREWWEPKYAGWNNGNGEKPARRQSPFNLILLCVVSHKSLALLITRTRGHLPMCYAHFHFHFHSICHFFFLAALLLHYPRSFSLCPPVFALYLLIRDLFYARCVFFFINFACYLWESSPQIEIVLVSRPCFSPGIDRFGDDSRHNLVHVVPRVLWLGIVEWVSGISRRFSPNWL